jgi:hypothetical protein
LRSLSLNTPCTYVRKGEPLRPLTEAVLERLEPAHQSLNPRGGGAIDHRAAA